MATSDIPGTAESGLCPGIRENGTHVPNFMKGMLKSTTATVNEETQDADPLKTMM